MYVGTRAGVFKSIDGGVSWIAVNTGFAATAIKAAVISGAAGTQTIFVGTWNGVFSSTDGGGSWSLANGGQAGSVNNLALDPRNAQTLYAGILFGGVFKSVNGGDSWSAVNEGLGITYPGIPATYYPNTASLAVDPADGAIYVGSNSGVFKSTDGGGSWATAGGLTGYVNALAIDPAHSGVVYAGSYDGVFKSTDGGATWVAKNAGMPFSKLVYSLAIDPANTHYVYAGGSYGVYASTDGGGSWTFKGPSSMVYPATSLAIDPDTHAIYAGTRGALYKTLNRGNSWSFVNIPAAHTGDFTAIAINGPTLFAVTDGGAVFKGSTVW